MAINDPYATVAVGAAEAGVVRDPSPSFHTPHRRNLRRVRVARIAAETLVVAATHGIAVVALATHAPRLSGAQLSVLLGLLVAGSLLALHRREPVGPLPPLRAAGVQRVLQTTGVAALSWIAADPLLNFSVPRILPVYDVLALALGLWALQAGLHAATVAARRRGHLLHEVLLVGCGEEVATIERAAIDHPDAGLALRGVVADRHAYEVSSVEAPWLGGVDDLLEIVPAVGADTVIVTPSGLPGYRVNEVVRDLLAHDIAVLVHNGLRSLSPQRVRVHALGYEPMLAIAPSRVGLLSRLAKRTMDLVGASLLLLLSLPILAVCALAIRREDGGPVLFAQERVGRDGETFTLLKLRTMCIDAEEQLDALLVDNRREGPLFKVEHDPRITTVGRILRATSLDELPQLFNVLRGDMSLVGPRPALLSETAQFDDELQARTRVTPGITGLWQVEARDSESFEAYRRLDLYYVENWSLLLDVSILATTVRAVGLRALTGVLGRGSGLD